MDPPTPPGLCAQLAYFKSLSGVALILQGAFGTKLSPFLLTPTNESRVRLARIQHLLKESSQMGERGTLATGFLRGSSS